MNKSTSFIEIYSIYTYKYRNYSTSSLVIIGSVFSIIGLLSGFLNGILCYLFATRKKIRSPSNLMTSILIWNNIFLVLVIIPINLFEICFSYLKYQEVFIGIRHYLIAMNTELNLYSVILISVNRMQKVKQNFASSNTNRRHLINFLIYYGIVIVASAFLPWIYYLFFSIDGSLVIAIMASIILAVLTIMFIISYAVIIFTVRRSKRNVHKYNVGETKTIYKDNTSGKLKRTIYLVMGSFAVLFMPEFVNKIFYVVRSSRIDLFADNEESYHTFRLVSVIAMSLSGIVNPLVYFYAQTNIRNATPYLKHFQKFLVP